jgi:hypothetical protein
MDEKELHIVYTITSLPDTDGTLKWVARRSGLKKVVTGYGNTPQEALEDLLVIIRILSI